MAADLQLDVQVTVPSAVVAAAHSLSRGAVIRESDLALVREAPRDGESGVFHSIEEVVGKQTTRASSGRKNHCPGRPASAAYGA